MTVAEVLVLLGRLDGRFGLSGDLVQTARQIEPRLNEEPLPDDFPSTDRARAEAERLTKGG